MAEATQDGLQEDDPLAALLASLDDIDLDALTDDVALDNLLADLLDDREQAKQCM